MTPEPVPSRTRRSGVEHEEEKAWISFYRRVGRDASLAAEVLVQLDADPLLKRRHGALYLCCRESQRRHKARQARDRQLAQLLRSIVRGVSRPVFVAAPAAIGRGLRRAADFVAMCMASAAQEPALAKVQALTRNPGLAAALDDFQARKEPQPSARDPQGEQATPSMPAAGNRMAV